MENSLTRKFTFASFSFYEFFVGIPSVKTMISFHKYVFQNLFLLSKFGSVSELGCKHQISLYALGVKKYSEDTDAY